MVDGTAAEPDPPLTIKPQFTGIAGDV